MSVGVNTIYRAPNEVICHKPFYKSLSFDSNLYAIITRASTDRIIHAMKKHGIT